MAAADDLARKLKRDQEFDDLARIALEAAPVLLFELIGGRKQGHEWVGARTAKGGVGDSWSINLKSGVWRHFAGTEHGTDIISLFAEILHVTMGAAAEDIRRRLGVAPGTPLPRNTLPYQPPEEPEADCDPIPYDAEPLKPHPAHGEPSHIHTYGRFMVVQRWDLPSGKHFAPWTWREGGWVNKAWPSPRPLYHLEYLSQYPDATVMVVEGEKCVDRASAVLEEYVVVSWYGGSQAWRLTDWEPLRGRSVLLWPDADEPGRKAAAQIAAHLHSIADSIRVVNPNGAADGWDIGEAVEEGWKEPEIRAFVEEHLAQPVAIPSRPSHGNTADIVPPPSPSSPLVTLASLNLEYRKGIAVRSVANVTRVLTRYHSFAGNIWFDEFRGAVYHTLHGPVPVRWTDAETRALTVNIQEQLTLHNFSTSDVAEGLKHAAECNRRNPLTEWLQALEWDGNERLSAWLADYAGVESTEYTQAVARNWPIAMVARAFDPGCKMDNMPVLEGVSGLSKTSFLEVLGGEWYKALPMDFGSKDFLQALRGAWLVEIPDMTGFGRVATSAILATLTIRNDTYRAPYGHEPQEYPRTCVFAATSETDDYLCDMRGKRRYWPLRCTDINLAGLKLARAQIFAEAVLRYREGAKWYEMPSTAFDEQIARASDEPWQEPILATAESWWMSAIATGASTRHITAKNLAQSCLSLEVGKLSDSDCRRVAAILRGAGWHRKRDKNGAFWIKGRSG